MIVTNEKELKGKPLKLHTGSAEVKELLVTPHVLTRLVFIEPNLVTFGSQHKHEQREAFYVIRGTVEFRNGGIKKELRAGDILIFDPYEEHYFTSGPDGVVLYEAIEKL